MGAGTYYSVFVTPRTGTYTYGTEVEITTYVSFNGLQSIKRAIDSTDYYIGIFYYGDIQLKVENVNGMFNDETDFRSIFKFSRDMAKIRVLFTNDDGSTITFRGLINEEATRLDPKTDEVNFRVLSLDSAIRNTNVAGGTVSPGMTVKQALAGILNIPAITSVLNYSDANNNPKNNFKIDVGSGFDDALSSDAVDQLLIASNSVMVIDSNQNIIIRARDSDTTRSIVNLYGPYDAHRRENIIDLSEYNTGKQRMFNSVLINTTEEGDTGLEVQYGTRQAKFTFDFITNPATEAAVATELLTEFKVPKIELQVTVPTSVVQGVQILDRVSLNYPLRLAPSGKFIPIVGVTAIGSATDPLPNTFGSVQINPITAFKVIEIDEDPNSFTTTLKLRQSGKNFNDGVFNLPTNAIVGFAIVGTAIVASGNTDPYNPSVIGAARVGSTRVA